MNNKNDVISFKNRKRKAKSCKLLHNNLERNCKIEYFTIKTGLYKFCKRNKYIYDKINEDVLEISPMMIEVSNVIYYHYSQQFENNPNCQLTPILTFAEILNFFKMLNADARDIRYKLNES